MKIEYACFSNIGDNTVNEDSVQVVEKGEIICFIVSDGLGGHGGGKMASEIVTRSVCDVIRDRSILSKELIDRCFLSAQKTLMENQLIQEFTNGMKATLVLMLTDRKKAIWGHVGDSRLYYYHNARYMSHTLDHSVPQMLVSLGELSEGEIRHHIDRNKLTKVLGIEWNKPMYEIDCEKHKLRKGDCFILCTDGFWEWFDEGLVSKKMLNNNSAKEAVTLLGNSALCNCPLGERDNTSAILVMIK